MSSALLKITRLLVLAITVVTTGCSKNKVHEKFDAPTTAGLPGKPQKHVPIDANSIITVNFLSKDTVWLIDGISYVPSGRTLTIEAGTFLTSGNFKTYNDPNFGPLNLRGVLVVSRGGKLIAIGNSAAPIVFTSPNATSRQPGNFGGIVLLGNAPINQPIQRITGIPDPVPTGVDANYGGTNAADSSGALSFVRIEFAGYRIASGNEMNGLVLGGVGNKTRLDHIQVSWSGADGFKFFGGTVTANHLLALSNEDDDFDFDYGYTGKIQYAISLKDSSSLHSKSGILPDANGLESQNDGTGSSATPTTKPQLLNFTMVGIKAASIQDTALRYGLRWRRATSLDFQSSIITGYDTAAAFESISCPATFSNNAYTGVLYSSPGLPCTYTGNTSAATIGALFSGDPFYKIGSSYSLSRLATVFAHASKGAIAAGSSWSSGWMEFQPKTY